MTIGCSCTQAPPFCDACLAQQMAWLGGVAGSRGTYWADRRARALNPAGVAWLDWELPATRDHARHLVADIGKDERLHEQLAERCWREAERRWRKLGGVAAAKAG